MKSTYRTAFCLLAAVSLSMILQSASCSKKDDQAEEPQGSKMNNFDLMSSAGKVWWISEVTLTYYGSTGGTDSTVTPVFRELEERLWFSKNFGYSDEREIYTAGPPLNTYMPANGDWKLNIPAQTLTLTCFDIRGTCTTEKDGVWQITRHNVSPYGESFRMERTIPLTGGRKVKVETRLFHT